VFLQRASHALTSKSGTKTVFWIFHQQAVAETVPAFSRAFCFHQHSRMHLHFRQPIRSPAGELGKSDAASSYG
jgi:hypothetical protein